MYAIDPPALSVDHRPMPNGRLIIDSLRKQISIAELIGESVTLVGVGMDMRGECTAHQDRDRGLFVDDAKGLYRCFACGRQGDVVQWVKEVDRCGEEEAIATLCRRAG